MARMMGSNYQSGWWCGCCTGPLETGRARENREARDEAAHGVEDHQWWTRNEADLYRDGHYADNPWADVHLRWHYPWGESRDEPEPAEWEDHTIMMWHGTDTGLTTTEFRKWQWDMIVQHPVIYYAWASTLAKQNQKP